MTKRRGAWREIKVDTYEVKSKGKAVGIDIFLDTVIGEFRAGAFDQKFSDVNLNNLKADLRNAAADDDGLVYKPYIEVEVVEDVISMGDKEHYGILVGLRVKNILLSEDRRSGRLYKRATYIEGNGKKSGEFLSEERAGRLYYGCDDSRWAWVIEFSDKRAEAIHDLIEEIAYSRRELSDKLDGISKGARLDPNDHVHTR